MLLGGVARIHAMDNAGLTCMPPLCENATTDEIVAHFKTLIKTWEKEASPTTDEIVDHFNTLIKTWKNEAQEEEEEEDKRNKKKLDIFANNVSSALATYHTEHQNLSLCLKKKLEDFQYAPIAQQAYLKIVEHLKAKEVIPAQMSESTWRGVVNAVDSYSDNNTAVTLKSLAADFRKLTRSLDFATMLLSSENDIKIEMALSSTPEDRDDLRWYSRNEIQDNRFLRLFIAYNKKKEHEKNMVDCCGLPIPSTDPEVWAQVEAEIEVRKQASPTYKNTPYENISLDDKLLPLQLY